MKLGKGIEKEEGYSANRFVHGIPLLTFDLGILACER